MRKKYRGKCPHLNLAQVCVLGAAQPYKCCMLYVSNEAANLGKCIQVVK